MTTLGDDELLIERVFDAPLALVFRLWESRDHMMRWWGPERCAMIELDWSLTPGRHWRGAMASKGMGIKRFLGVIREVVKNERIVFTFRWDDASNPHPDTLITVTFAEKDGRTIQSFHQAPFFSVESRDSHVGGWSSLFNKQQVYVEAIAAAEQEGFRA